MSIVVASYLVSCAEYIYRTRSNAAVLVYGDNVRCSRRACRPYQSLLLLFIVDLYLRFFCRRRRRFPTRDFTVDVLHDCALRSRHTWPCLRGRVGRAERACANRWVVCSRRYSVCGARSCPADCFGGLRSTTRPTGSGGFPLPPPTTTTTTPHGRPGSRKFFSLGQMSFAK